MWSCLSPTFKPYTSRLFSPSNNSAQECFYSMFFGEITNPFNILRQNFAVQDRKRDSFLAGIIFIGAFIPVRSLICTWVSRFITLSPETSRILKLNASLMLLVSFIWIWRILNLASKQYAESKPQDPVAQSFYKKVKSLRKYEAVWNFGSAAIAFYWFAWSTYYDFAGWPSHYLPHKH